VNDPFDPLPAETNTNLHLLINSILNKDYNKRPNINDLAKIPCMNKYIHQFLEKYNLKQEVLSLLDVIDNNKNNNKPNLENSSTTDYTETPTPQKQEVKNY
jgi:hypothetical protein